MRTIQAQCIWISCEIT